MSTPTQEADMENIMHVADCACIPRPIMMHLMNDELVCRVNDIHLVSDDVKETRRMYEEKYNEDSEKLRLWSHKNTGRFKFMIEWYNSYQRMYGRSSAITEIDRENFCTLPDEVVSSMGQINVMAQSSPKEQYDLLSEGVKDILRQQHAFYHEQIKLL